MRTTLAALAALLAGCSVEAATSTAGNEPVPGTQKQPDDPGRVTSSEGKVPGHEYLAYFGEGNVR
jgi:hypothetical protein